MLVSSKKIIISGLCINFEQIEWLTSHGFEVLFVEKEDAAIPSSYYDAEFIICNWFFKYHDISRFKKLRFIQLLSAGTERLPIDT